MTFDDILDHAIAMLQRRGRLTYRTLKRQFDLDDAALEDLKEELIYGQRLAVDEDARVLVWTGDAASVSSPPTSVTVSAPALDQKPPPIASAPSYLTEKILTSRRALEGERKQVTVLFADLQGSTALIADLDPEAAQRLLDPALHHMVAAVHRYEGTVNQVLGDGIMALFGAPVAHEDHAVRACYAALAMQAAMRHYAEEVRHTQGLELQIRVGLNSGDVVVRAIGDDLHMDYSAVGQTTHLAARMEQLATPGSIRLTASTLRLVEDLVQVKALGRFPVKGLSEPVEAYELLGATPLRRRFQASAARGLTRFVGRQAELTALHQALERAGAGQGQVVAVIGEPAVGKTRLFHEFTHGSRTRGWLLLASSATPYGRAMPYLPVIDLCKTYLHLEDRDDGRRIREKLTERLLTLDAALEPSLPAFLSLLEVPVEDASWHALDPPQRRQRTLDALKRLLLRESQRQPLLLVCENLHWIDTETQAFLDGLVESLPAARVLLLVNYRPEYQHGWGQKTYYTQLRLDPLPPASAEAMLQSLLGDHAELEPLTQRVIERTQGNPFFLEESVRTLVETRLVVGTPGAYRLAGALPPSLQIPATVQAVLAARIDRLPSEDKRLLQAASVIGKDVPFTLLLAIAGLAEADLRRGLAHLQAAEFLYETNLFPDLEYTFKHALTHEVTYGGLLQERRRELHARIVTAIETLQPERLGEQIERLAHHALRGEVWDKAVSYLRQAGRKATARSALPDARGWFEQALGVLATLPESPSTLEQGFGIRLDLQTVLTGLGDVRRALERQREAEVLTGRLYDDGRRGQVSAFTILTHTLLGELDEALVAGTRALEIAERFGDLRLRLQATTYLEQTHYYRGDYHRVVELATKNLAVLPADWVYEHCGMMLPVSIYCRYWLVMSLAELGRFTEATTYEAEMLRLAETTHDVTSVGRAHFAAGRLHLLQGDWTPACAHFERAIVAYRTGNIGLSLPHPVAASAWVLAQVGEASETLTRLREAEELLDRNAARGGVDQQGGDYHWLGRAALLLGRLDEAQCLGDRALEYSPSHPGFAAHALHLLGDIATHPDRFDAERGEAHYRQALALAEPRGMRSLQAHCHRGLGTLYRQTGQAEHARAELSTAIAMYRDMAMTFWLPETEAVLADVEER